MARAVGPWRRPGPPARLSGARRAWGACHPSRTAPTGPGCWSRRARSEALPCRAPRPASQEAALARSAELRYSTTWSGQPLYVAWIRVTTPADSAPTSAVYALTFRPSRPKPLKTAWADAGSARWGSGVGVGVGAGVGEGATAAGLHAAASMAHATSAATSRVRGSLVRGMTGWMLRTKAVDSDPTEVPWGAAGGGSAQASRRDRTGANASIASRVIGSITSWTCSIPSRAYARRTSATSSGSPSRGGGASFA